MSNLNQQHLKSDEEDENQEREIGENSKEEIGENNEEENGESKEEERGEKSKNADSSDEDTWTRIRIHNGLETNTGKDRVDVHYFPDSESSQIEEIIPKKPKKKKGKQIARKKVTKDVYDFDSDPDNLNSSFERNRTFKRFKKSQITKRLKSEKGKESSTDIDENDDHEFTTARRISKRMRYEDRVVLKIIVSPSNEEGNKEVVERFINFLKCKYSVTLSKQRTSTYDFSLSHLFYYEDSLLNFELEKDPTYKLIQLVEFDHPKYRELSDPSEWILRAAGETGEDGSNDRVEMVKAWKRFYHFIKDQLNKSRVKCGTSIDPLMRHQLLINNLDNLFNSIITNNLMKNAKITYKCEKREKENAEEYYSPNKRLAEKDAVKNWFNSQKYRLLLDENVELWRNTMETRNMSNKDFTRFAQFVKFTLCLISKNRNSVFKFTNKDYIWRKPLWTQDSNDTNYENLQLNCVPEPPQDDSSKPPDCWIIKLSGSGAGIKSQAAQTIFINRPCQDLLHKYSDLKQIFIPDVALDAPFFVNLESKVLPDIQNTKGSLWDKFGQVTNLDKASINTIRRGLEHEVQSSPVALTKIQDIQSHSQETGTGAYYKTSPYVRASFMHKVANKEGANNFVENEEIPEDIQKLREEREENERKKCREAAKSRKRKSQTRKRISQRTRLLPKDRDYLEGVFLDNKYEEIHNALKEKFPPKRVFKRLFYRLLDGHMNSMSDEAKQQLKEIEERIFLTVKEDIESIFKQSWANNSQEMNKVADERICAIIRNSFYYREKNRPCDEDPVFNFKK